MAAIDGLKDGSHFIQAWKMYPLLEDRGFFAKGKLKDSGGSCGIHGVRIVILSKEAAREEAARRKMRFVHRVLAVCDCGRQVPFGKLGQHRKSCDANLFAD